MLSTLDQQSDAIIDLARAWRGEGRLLMLAAAFDAAQFVPLAESEGDIIAAMPDEDQRVFWAGLGVCAGKPKDVAGRVIREGLRQAGCWADNAGLHDGWCCMWSCEALARVLMGVPATPDIVRGHARRLLELNRRWQAAERLSDQFAATLSGYDVPEVPAGKQTIIMRPSRRRGA